MTVKHPAANKTLRLRLLHGLFPLFAAGVLAGLPPSAHAQGTAESSRNSPEVPPVTVSGTVLEEERLVGSYFQPEWATERRFATSRASVLPEGMVELEQRWRGTYKRDGSEAHRLLTEIRVGLPNR